MRHITLRYLLSLRQEQCRFKIIEYFLRYVQIIVCINKRGFKGCEEGTL